MIHIARSIHQPWADAIVGGWKRIELRPTRTHHRGRLLICSSKMYKGKCLPKGGWPKGHDGATRLYGYALGFVDVTGCRRATPDDAKLADVHRDTIGEYPRLWAWLLGNPDWLYEPFPVIGRQGQFSVEREEEAFRIAVEEGPEV